MSGSAPGKKSSRSMRQFPRFQLDVRMLVHLFRDGATTTVWGRSTSLGQEGIGATLTGEMEIGEVVGLEFSVPLLPQPVKLRAIVRYKNGFQYGFEFLAVDSNLRHAIQRAIDILPPVLWGHVSLGPPPWAHAITSVTFQLSLSPSNIYA